MLLLWAGWGWAGDITAVMYLEDEAANHELLASLGFQRSEFAPWDGMVGVPIRYDQPSRWSLDRRRTVLHHRQVPDTSFKWQILTLQCVVRVDFDMQPSKQLQRHPFL